MPLHNKGAAEPCSQLTYLTNEYASRDHIYVTVVFTGMEKVPFPFTLKRYCICSLSLPLSSILCSDISTRSSMPSSFSFVIYRSPEGMTYSCFTVNLVPRGAESVPTYRVFDAVHSLTPTQLTDVFAQCAVGTYDSAAPNPRP